MRSHRLTKFCFVLFALVFLLIPLHRLGAYEATNSSKISSDNGISGNEACTRVLAELKKQNKMLSRDLGHIKRELLHLKYEISRPGLKEIFGGIGYILGIFGVAAYMKARQMEKEAHRNHLKE